MIYQWNKRVFDSLLTRKDRLPHALLLRGPQGIGKLALAESLARALLCEKPGPAGVSCGACPACGWMEQGSHPDFRRLEPESLAESGEGEDDAEKREKASDQITVEQVRAIADFVNVTSHRGGAKIVLVHPAEALNVNAANALLKGLEEPPLGTYFLLVSHRWHQLLATIRSRCQHVALGRPSAAAASDWLGKQGLANPDLALAQTGGAPLLAAQLDEEYWLQREQFLKALAARNFDALAVAERLRDHAPARIVTWLQKWTFDVVSCQATGTVRYNPDQSGPIAALAASVDPVDAARFARRMVRLQRIVAHPLNARLFFEDLMLSYSALLRGRIHAAA